MLLRFEGRVLAVDAAIADAWGRLTALREAAGRPITMAGGKGRRESVDGWMTVRPRPKPVRRMDDVSKSAHTV